MISQFALLLSILTPISGPVVSAQTIAHARAIAVKRLICKPQNPGVPAYLQTIDVSAYRSCNATIGLAGPWSATLSPDGNFFYVPLSGFAGAFMQENCLLAKVDVASNQVVSTISVGLFPEEIAFTTHPNGSMEYGFLTNSSSGTVTVIDAADQVVTTIALPDPFGFGTCYPFGIAVSPNQSRLYVGTVDGSGEVYAVNTQTLQVVPSETMNFPGTHGRLAFYGNTLLVPITEYNSSFTFSFANLGFVNPANPSGATTLLVMGPTFTNPYPSAQDIAVRCDGRAYLVGLGLNSAIHVFDAKTRAFLHEIAVPTAGGYHQGIGLSSRGLLAVGDYGTDEVSFFNIWNEGFLATIDLTSLPDFHSFPYEFAFSKDGKKMIVPNNGSDSLAVFQIP